MKIDEDPKIDAVKWIQEDSALGVPGGGQEIQLSADYYATLPFCTSHTLAFQAVGSYRPCCFAHLGLARTDSSTRLFSRNYDRQKESAVHDHPLHHLF